MRPLITGNYSVYFQASEMSYTSTALHVTTLQGFHFSDDIKANLPFFSSKKCKKKQDMVEI